MIYNTRPEIGLKFIVEDLGGISFKAFILYFDIDRHSMAAFILSGRIIFNILAPVMIIVFNISYPDIELRNY